MMLTRSSIRAAAARVIAALSLAAAGPAFATNGYFSAGYGLKNEAVAGAGIAFPQDSLSIATNPSGLVLIDDSFDLGVDLFLPKRSATLIQGGSAEEFDGNGTKDFYLPSIGYGRHVTQDLALGIALYGNGGLNTDYRNNPFARFHATGSAGVNLEQLFVTPALAWQYSPGQSLGIGLNLAYQRFSAKGIGIFGYYSSDGAHVSDQGNDSSTGFGARVGWTGRLTDYLTLGATWQSKTSTGRFKHYAGLFADQGGFDIPSTYGLGLALNPTHDFTVAFDWQRINYADVHSVGNPIDSLFAGVPLGASNGPGFGWRNVNVYKLGGTLAINQDWTLRLGVSTSKQPVPSSQTFFNILAPGVVETHFTGGASWRITGADELNASLLYAPKKTVYGDTNTIPPSFGGGEVDISLQETSIGIGWSHHFGKPAP